MDRTNGAEMERASLPPMGSTVLVIDDEVLTRLGIAAMMETVGLHAICPTQEERAALDIVGRQACDLVIVDVNQAGGVATRMLVDRLRSAGTAVLVTSPERPAFFTDAPRLPKPFAAHEIVSAARAALQ